MFRFDPLKIATSVDEDTDVNLKDDRALSLLHQELPQILVLCFP